MKQENPDFPSRWAFAFPKQMSICIEHLHKQAYTILNRGSQTMIIGLHWHFGYIIQIESCLLSWTGYLISPFPAFPCIFNDLQLLRVSIWRSSVYAYCEWYTLYLLHFWSTWQVQTNGCDNLQELPLIDNVCLSKHVFKFISICLRKQTNTFLHTMLC